MISDDDFCKKIDNLLKKFGLVPKKYEYYFKAFTHPSAATTPANSYENLELLGDAIVLSYVIRRLYMLHPDAPVGILARAKSQIVSGKTLSKISGDLKLHKLLRYDESILNFDKKISKNVQADILEALVAAVYLDLGVTKTRKFLGKLFTKMLEEDLLKISNDDSKSCLQETLQKKYKQVPQYKIIKTTGPDHNKMFHVQVFFRGIPMEKGVGPTRKLAEQNAAKKTLQKIEQYLKKIDKTK